MTSLWCVSALMHDMVVDQPPKKMRMCQHLKSAVARMAFMSVGQNLRGAANGSGGLIPTK